MLTPVQVPQTKTKLAQSLSLISYQQVDEGGLPISLPKSLSAGDLVNSVVNSGAALSSIKPLGEVFGFNIKQDRQNTYRRGINNAIEPWATLPGPITTTLEIDRAVLYTGDAMKAFNFHSGNIAFQVKPLAFVELTYVPEDDNGKPMFDLGANLKSNRVGSLTVNQILSAAGRSPIYMNCWIASRTLNYRLEGNQMVVENLTLNVGTIFSAMEAAMSAGGSMVSQLLNGTPVGTVVKNLASKVPILKSLV